MEAQLHDAGPPLTLRRMVDSVQRVARPPLIEIARGEAVVIVDGIEQLVVVERHERPRGGFQIFWRCPLCDARRCHLFVISGALACRCCHGLDYRSRHTLHPALTKAAKLRRKIGAAPGVLSKLPKRPPHWRRDYWIRSLRELAAAERVIAELLGATLRAAKRQKARLLDGQQRRAR